MPTVTSEVIFILETLISPSVGVGIGSNFHSVKGCFVTFDVLYPGYSLVIVYGLYVGVETAEVHQNHQL